MNCVRPSVRRKGLVVRNGEVLCSGRSRDWQGSQSRQVRAMAWCSRCSWTRCLGTGVAFLSYLGTMFLIGQPLLSHVPVRESALSMLL